MRLKVSFHLHRKVKSLHFSFSGCCGSGRESQSIFVRWFIGIISLIGLSCVIVGIVLGALTISGSTRLTLCLLMIGKPAI